MEREQYAVMFRREERHWWYAGMRRTALALLARGLRDLAPAEPWTAVRSAGGYRRPLRLLDAGCGTGGTTIHLRRFGEVVGLDLHWEALLPARQRGLRRLTRATIERLPFRDASFDVVTSFEVVYHLGVGDDRSAFAELRRVLRPGGLLLLRVPAHDWLRGEHDRLVHTRHRYDRAEVAARLREAGFVVERLSWANSALFVPAAAKRLLERPRAHPPAAQAAAEPDLWQPPAPLNAALERLVGLEAWLTPRGVPLPFGLSVIALGRAA